MVSGNLPAVILVDPPPVDLPISGNRVRFTIADRTSSRVEFSVTAQLVNAAGDLGPASTAMSAEDSTGCTATRTNGISSSIWLFVLGLALAFKKPRMTDKTL